MHNMFGNFIFTTLFVASFLKRDVTLKCWYDHKFPGGEQQGVEGHFRKGQFLFYQKYFSNDIERNLKKINLILVFLGAD